MSNQQHTPEPWAVFNGPAVEGVETWSESYIGTIVRHGSNGGKRIADTSIGLSQDYDEGKANARRIVACVNACAGLSDDDLNAICLEGGVGAGFVAIRKLKQQRDELHQRVEQLLEECLNFEGEAVKAKQQRDELHESYAQLESRCFEGFASGTDGIFDALRVAEQRADQLAALNAELVSAADFLISVAIETDIQDAPILAALCKFTYVFKKAKAVQS